MAGVLPPGNNLHWCGATSQIMETVLSVTIATSAINAGVLSLTLLYMSTIGETRMGLRQWAVAVGLLIMHNTMALAWAGDADGAVLHFILSEGTHLVGGLFLLSGAQAFSGQASRSPVLVVGGVIGLGWLFLMPLAGFPFSDSSMIVHVFGGLIVCFSGFELLRGKIQPRPLTAFVGITLFSWGSVSLALLAFPSALMSLLAGQAFGVVAAVGFILLASRRQATLLSEARERARVSERDAAEQAQHIRQVLDSLPDAVMTVDSHGRIHDFNPSACRIFGYDADDVRGRDASTLLPVKGAAREPGGLIHRLAKDPDFQKRRQIEDFMALRRDGSRIPVEVMVNTVTVGGRDIYVGLVRDISEGRLASRFDDFLHGLDRKALRTFRTDELDAETCSELASILDAPLVLLINRDGEAGFKLRAAAGPDAGTRTRVAIAGMLDDEFRGSGPFGDAVRTGQTETIQRTGPNWLFEVLPGQYDWAMIMPLWIEKDVGGLLIVIGTDPQPDSNTVLRLESAAARIGATRQSVRDQQKLRLQGTAMAAAANAIFITNVRGEIEWVNDAFTRLSGFEATEVIGKTPAILRSGLQGDDIYARLWATITSGQVWRGEMVEMRKDGSLYTVDQTIAPILDETGAVAHFVAVHEDVTDRKKAEERVLYLSNYDTLTRLPNRVLFRDHLYQAVTQARNTRTSLAVLFIDLDRFSRVNDTLGHDVGDQLLMTVASRINAAAAPHADTVARIGGDEFALIQTKLPNAEAAAALARRVIEVVNKPVDLDGLEVQVGANVGIAIYPQDGDDPDHMIKNADMAMYRAIRSETDNYYFFSNDMNDEARIRLGLEGDLRRAIENRELELYFQPQINVKTRRIVGAEALLRWQHPQQGPISPARFIPVAEDSGLILPIGDWVLNEALRQAAQWRMAGLPLITIAVNISAVQFRQKGLVKTVKEAIALHGMDPSRLELELTESMLMQDARGAVQVLSELSDLGALLAIDDFGTGYSSLSYLKQFPVDKLKLDQSFVRHLTTDHNDAVIARATINLGHSLNLEVIAEGVETEEQYEYLKAEGCDVIQGFLFGRPVPADAFAAMLLAEVEKEDGITPHDAEDASST